MLPPRAGDRGRQGGLQPLPARPGAGGDRLRRGRGLHHLRRPALPAQARRRRPARAAARQHDRGDHLDHHPDGHRLHPLHLQHDHARRRECAGEDPVTIEVEGFQWQWTFHYENGASETGSAAEPPVLAVPVGEPVRLILHHQRREPLLLRAAVPHQTRPHRLRRRPAAERARVHRHRSRHLFRRLRRVLRHRTRRHGLHGRCDVARRLRCLRRGAARPASPLRRPRGG